MNQTLEEAADHFRLGFANSIIAFGVAILCVVTVGAPLGMARLEAPLFWAIIVNTLAAGLIAAMTGRINNENFRPALSKQRAAAAYVFTNSASALTMLATHFVERLEIGNLTGVRNGLTLLLDSALGTETNSIYQWTYLGTVLFSIGLAFILVLQGSRLFSSNESEGPEVGRGLGPISTFLLILSMSIGSTWQPVPFESQEIVGWYGLALTWAFIFMCILLMLAYCFFSFFAAMNIVSILISRIVERSMRLSLSEVLAVLSLIGRKLLFGAIRAVMGLAALSAVLLGSILSLEALIVLPETVFAPMSLAILAFGRELLTFIVTAFVVLLIAATVTFITPRLWWGAISLYKSGRRGSSKALETAFLALSRMSQRAGNLTRETTERFRAWWRSRDRTRKFVRLTSVFVAAKAAAGISVAQSVFRHLAGNITNIALMAVVGITLASSTLDQEFTLPDEPASEQDENPVASDKEEPSGDDEESTSSQEQLVREVEHVFVDVAPVCQLNDNIIEWSFGETDMLEIPVSSCTFPFDESNAQTAVLVLGVSSTGSNVILEENRAKARGFTLANLVSNEVPISTPIFVLDLGMANHRESLSSMRAIWNFDSDQRPAMAAVLRPYPEDAVVREGDFVQRIEEMIRWSGVLSNFSNCELYRYTDPKTFDPVIRKLPEFDCS